jgi:hypothetical protein
MKTKKVNGFGNLVKKCSRFKPFSDRERKKRTLRNRILEIQETLGYLNPLRGNIRIETTTIYENLMTKEAAEK